MNAADIIRDSIAEVEHLRQSASRQEGLAAAISTVKGYQSRRFAATYRDLIAGGPFQRATTFFLEELYGDTNYSRRDAQFSRIAGAIQRLLPEAAVATAVALARLHALTERLDLLMGEVWLAEAAKPEIAGLHGKYVRAWQIVGHRSERNQQLQLVLDVGSDLDLLTQKSGLRMLLRMMRAPSQAAGLSDLRHFLELGFDPFSALGSQKGKVNEFLRIIETRESSVLRALFSYDLNSAREYLISLHEKGQ